MITVHVADLPTALHQFTVALLLAAVAWAGLVALLASWRPTRRLAMALTPRLLRAAVFTTVSGSLVISPAYADNELDGLPFPDRGTTPQPVAVNASSDSGTHVVQPGESLWTIAASVLPPDADAAQVSSASTAWYETNRTTIGADPNLIHPGQQLVPPDEAGQTEAGR